MLLDSSARPANYRQRRASGPRMQRFVTSPAGKMSFSMAVVAKISRICRRPARSGTHLCRSTKLLELLCYFELRWASKPPNAFRANEARLHPAERSAKAPTDAVMRPSPDSINSMRLPLIGYHLYSAVRAHQKSRIGSDDLSCACTSDANRPTCRTIGASASACRKAKMRPMKIE